MVPWAASLLESPAPWLTPYDAVRGRLAGAARSEQPVAEWLNFALAGQPDVMLDAGQLRFVPQDRLPPGEAYESFIARTASVPTRDTLHDLCNGLVWLRFPCLKRHLNRLHAAAIANDGIGSTRGAVRDALTLFDENAALWRAPGVLADALAAHDWQALFGTHRELWRTAAPMLFGHALIEKLCRPRKPITAHVWLVSNGADIEADMVDRLTLQRLATGRLRLNLPMLGVPGWWPGNASTIFYDDPDVFRPLLPRGQRPQHIGAVQNDDSGQ